MVSTCVVKSAGNLTGKQRYFKDGVEKAPRDLTAWTGLAASYDRLLRFDLADQAYAQAVRLGGETPQILNDQGYSYMLRGNLTAARRKFNDWHVDRSIYVIDSSQSLYFQQVFRVLELWGFKQADKAFQLAYERVITPEGAISSRRANPVTCPDHAGSAGSGQDRRTSAQLARPDLRPPDELSGQGGSGRR